MAIDAGTILAHIDMDAAGFMGTMDGAAQRLTDFAQGELPDAVAAATGALEAGMNAETGEAVSAAWMQGVCAGVETARGALEADAEDAAQGAADAARERMNAATGEAIGADWMAGVAGGIGGAAGSARSSASAAADGAVSAAAQAMSAGRGREIGEAMVSGMAQGVRAGAGGLYAAMGSVAREAVRRAKTALSIRSPSGVFAEGVGAWIPAGIGEGIRAHAQDAISPLESLSQSMLGEAGTLGAQAGEALARAWDGAPGGEAVMAGEIARSMATAADAVRAGGREAAQPAAATAYALGGAGPGVRIEVTGDWTVRAQQDQEEIIDALSERISEELRRR